MPLLIDEILYRIRMVYWRQRQYTSAALRAYFARRFNVQVGLYSYGCFDRWRMPGPLRIGRYCSFARTARVANTNHPFDVLTSHPVLYDPGFGIADRRLPPPPPLVIEDDVWVGAFAMILPGCRFVGRGSVIGAGAIVTSDVPAYSMVVGNPARPLRSRFEPVAIEALEASRWWELDLADLRTFVAENPDLAWRPNLMAKT